MPHTSTRPGVGPAQPGHDRHQRRLARAVGAEQPEDRPGLDAEVDAGERHASAPYDFVEPSTASAATPAAGAPLAGRYAEPLRCPSVCCIPVSIYDARQHFKGRDAA